MFILLVIFISVLSFLIGFALAKKTVLPVKHKVSLESSKDEEYENTHVLLTRLPLSGNPNPILCKHAIFIGPLRTTCMS